MINALPDRSKLRDGDWRMTVHCIQHGQPRPYAPHIYINRVYFEWIPYDTRIKPEDKNWVAVQWAPEIIKSKLKTVQFFYEKKDMPNPFSPELVRMVKIQDGLWEFEVREAFTD